MYALGRLLAFGFLSLAVFQSHSEGPLRPNLSRKPGGFELSWPGVLRGETSVKRPFFEVERSADLNEWQPFGERMRVPEGSQARDLFLDFGSDHARLFFRVRSFEPHLSISALGRGGSEVFGYAAALSNELARVGQISAADFQRAYPPGAEYLPSLTWNPTNAQFWADYSANPAVINAGKTWGSPGYRLFDFRLNPLEMAVFRTNGFVVSERLGAAMDMYKGTSMADAYYLIWQNDLPVFITTDSILQAWHRTYDTMIQEMELVILGPALEGMLSGMAGKLEELALDAGTGPLSQSVRDMDFFLAVARSLLAGAQQPSRFGQDAEVAAMLSNVSAYRFMQLDLFGQCRTIDFSQFRPRGHYTFNLALRRYFQCMTWLGRIDLPVAGGPFERCPGTFSMATPRDLGNAIVLWDALRRSGSFDNWLKFDRSIRLFVGWSDSMDFAQLGGLLAGAGIGSVRDVSDLAALEALQNRIATGQLGVQNIRSDYFISPCGAEQARLPQAFHFLGQRFTPESWVFSQTVYDSILWDGRKVQRRVPSALDMAFAVFGNNQVVPELLGRIARTNALAAQTHAERWRDGLPYQHNLAALRNVIDAQDASSWQSSIYMGWLNALRQLSLPTTSPAYPEAMRTRAWAMKTLNTQLASWTQLRHDNILYAKQSYTAGYVCFYPDGFVEPRVEFWAALRDVALRAADFVESMEWQGTHTYIETKQDSMFFPPVYSTNTIPLAEVQGRQIAHFRKFAGTLATLETLSRKELAQESFSEAEQLFIRDLIENVGSLPDGSGSVRKYDGWYPRLFYKGIQHLALAGAIGDHDFQQNYGADATDHIVADVHTDVPAPGDPGGVLHQAVGRVNLLMIAVDSGPDKMIFAGPVLSHYEFEIVGEPFVRMTDVEWTELNRPFPNYTPDYRSRMESFAPPSWTESYLVQD